jgi:hypothetical protein
MARCCVDEKMAVDVRVIAGTPGLRGTIENILVRK